MKLHKAKIEDWKPVCEPVWLASLPFKYKDFIAKFDLEFLIEVEDGMGETAFACAMLDQTQLWFQSRLISGDDAYLALYVHGTEENWEKVLNELCAACGISQADLLAKQTELRPGRFSLWRLDDNSNEVLMFRFPDRLRAEQCQRLFTDRGHKQIYFVRSEEE